MKAVAFSDAVLLVVVVAAMGLSLATWWMWVAMATVVGALALTGHYRPRITLSVAREAGSIAACVMAPFVVLALARVHGASTARLLVTGAIVTAAVVFARCATYWVVRMMRTRGWFAERTLFVGAGDVSAKMAGTLKEHPEYGLSPVGFLDEVDSAGLPLPLFGGVGMLRMVLSEERIDRVVERSRVGREVLPVSVLGAQALQARYGFTQLKAWHDRHRLLPLAIPGVVLFVLTLLGEQGAAPGADATQGTRDEKALAHGST